MLKVKLFAKAREVVGSPVAEVPWTDGQTVLQLKQVLLEKHPGLQPMISRLLVAVNNDYAPDDAAVKTNDEVACFPPVSGG
ncbi:MAG: MoaD/ThiS family protein [Schlesneria sp.]